ncbi:MAG: amino acid adenylation domain-containing protein, partial [Parasporobacterium sp.]|nr:amino acid adenylation domain-containing protein [Parasporobacterium sp.]
MNTIDYKKIIRRYAETGIRLWAEGDKLKYSAARNENGVGGLDSEKLDFLKAHKTEILDELKKDDERFLLTDIQSAYVLGRMDSFDYGGVSCKIYLELIYDELHPDKCKDAWNTLIARHEMLRAVIFEDGYQLIKEYVPELKITYYDFRTDPEGLKDLRKEMSEKTFPIGGWPYFEVALSKQDKGTVMHLCFDFLIADWNSIWLLIGEFEDIYFRNNTQKTETLSFKEYLRLENELLSKPEGIRDKEYWVKRIPDLPSRPLLHIKDKECLESGFDRLIFELNKNKWDMFCENVKAIGSTPTAAVLAAYAITLANWSQNKHFSLNLTLLNRMPISPDVYNIVGDFTSVSLLEVNLLDKDMFKNIAKAVQKQMMEDLDHRLFSGVKTMREYSAVHGKDEALFPYVFTGSIGLVKSENQIGKPTGYGKSSTPQVFIDCQAMDSEDGLRINWDVRRGVFEDELLNDMFESFKHIMERLCESEKNWEETDLVHVPKKQLEVRDRVNNTTCDYPDETLFSLVWKAMKKYPENIAAVDEHETISYGELKRRVVLMASNLMDAGVKKHDNIGIIMSKGINQLAAVIAVLGLEAVYVPMDKEQPLQRIKTINEKANIKLNICESKSLSDFEGEIGVISDEKLLESRKICYDFEKYENNTDDVAYIIFTSGSTGEPKGVVISNKAAVNTILDVNAKFKVSESDRAIALSKLNFDLSVYDIFGLLSVGGAIVFPCEDKYLVPSHWHELVKQNKITLWNTVPAFMQMYADYLENEDLNSNLRLVLMSGDWIGVNLPSLIGKHNENVTVVSLGGATEASIWSNYYICNKDEVFKKSIPYGYPLSNQGFFIADEKGMPVCDYVTGELCIYGKGLAQGYLNDKEQTGAQFVFNDYLNTRVYKTGDYGYYRTDGAIVFLGRKDAQVKIRGHRIELGEIEKTLMRHKNVEDAVALVCERQGRQKDILCLVTAKSKTKGNDLESTESDLQKLEIPNLNNDKKWEKDLDDASDAAMLDALKKLGIIKDNKLVSEDEIKNNPFIKKEYGWLVGYWISSLKISSVLTCINRETVVSEEGKKLELKECIDALKNNKENYNTPFGRYVCDSLK